MVYLQLTQRHRGNFVIAWVGEMESTMNVASIINRITTVASEPLLPVLKAYTSSLMQVDQLGESNLIMCDNIWCA